ncbi:SNF2 family domain-containing protein [Colletotrichum graminicola]|uniref:SNF2 family domain-containing protein n=1 Tax=Colletotrichum graminicola (strain M1.001 / M2 / FGSC 10212) TaxID=645133 RepID=E3QFP5_COLGM|nr:SNF2 family domain-containing protein [Colletotrichum graminicola M1.001]EFQ29730.1 SNF2 family domain-containing protein [Colletotrichum graminicola M1.001]WDK12499.1 SNF2 family domain-containing protein [Colletotrichum graminicola]
MTSRRARAALAAEESLASTRSNSPDAAPPTGIGRRLTRSASAKNLAVPAQSVTSAPSAAKRGRGRPSKNSSLANDSVSSAPSAAASADFTSASEDSTPATSNVATPAPSITADGLGSRRIASKIEVQLPTAAGLQSERALRRSQYSMAPIKRKRSETGGSDDEDDEEYSDNDRDAIVARRLQKEENRKAKTTTRLSDAALARRLQEEEFGTDNPDALVTTRRGRSNMTSTQAAITDSDAEMSEDIPLAARVTSGGRQRGRPARSNISLAQRPTKRQKNILHHEDQDELAASAREDEHDGADFGLSSDEEDSGDEFEPKKSASKGKKPVRQTRNTASSSTQPPAALEELVVDDEDALSSLSGFSTDDSDASNVASTVSTASDSDGRLQNAVVRQSRGRRALQRGSKRRGQLERDRLVHHHPELLTMWQELEALPPLRPDKIAQPKQISRQLKPFQLQGVAWMIAMEQTDYRGGLLGDEMGLGKTIQAVSLIMSDFPSKKPSLVLVPPVALMQWQSEITAYTDGTLKTFVYHGSLAKAKNVSLKELKKFDVIMMSYNSLESMYRKQEKGFTRKDGIYKERSLIHQIEFHRIILDEAHSIKTRTTMTAKACFALKTDFRWCLTGTPLQNRIGEFFSLVRFLQVKPFASYFCKQCPCASLDWDLDDDHRCRQCHHAGMQHVSVFNQELLTPIQKWGNMGEGADAFRKLRTMTDRIMLRRLKKDHTDSMELPVKEVYVDRQFFGEVENDFANSIMTNGQRKFDTYVAQGVLLNNYANIFGLIMQMRQVADHPDLILRKNGEGGQNTLMCNLCDEVAEDCIRSRCKHDFCRACARTWLAANDQPDCPKCHILLAIDLEQPEIEQNEADVKKSSIINRIKMEEWTSSSKIELLVHELHKLRSDNASHKSIIFSQFSSMLQLIEWRLRRAGITTVMLDGSMNPAQRQASINHFMTKTDCECFLVSLKAGGVALNLTEASRVFIVDPWWNPAAEWQSADRCHRIGQTRPCTITRLCIEDSVESRMVLIQEKKTNMINSTVNADDKAMESLSPQDMQFLFRGS